MNLAVWRTGHEIADTVADALAEGLDAVSCHTASLTCVTPKQYDANIAYGILRGTKGVFRRCGNWFNVDRGYFAPSHFDGYYRISHRGTQARWHEGIPRKPIDITLEPMRTGGEYDLICPPTKPVCDFFGIDPTEWSAWALSQSKPGEFLIRTKGEAEPIEWGRLRSVITFNSSVGWQVLQRGIPVLSSVEHSTVGSYYACTNMQSLTDFLSNSPDTRMELFEAMNAHQFTLDEIRAGEAWPLIKHYLSISDMIHGKQLPAQYVPTPSNAALKARFQSST